MAGLISDSPGGLQTLSQGNDLFEYERSGVSYEIELQDMIGNPNYIVGRWYQPRPLTYIAGAAPGANNLKFFKSHILQDCTIDQLGAEVTTPQASQNFQCAVYNTNTATGFPGTLIKNTASISTTNAVAIGGAMSDASSPTLYAGRYYWWALACDHATPVFAGVTNTNGIQAATVGSATIADVTGATFFSGYTYAGTFGTWPDMTSLSGSLVGISNGSMPQIVFRVASVL